MAASGNSDFTSSLVKLIYDTFPKQNEEILHVKQRCDLIKMYLKDLVQSRKDLGQGKEEGKVAVVGHSMFFRVYTT